MTTDAPITMWFRVGLFAAQRIPWGRIVPTLALKWFGVLSLRVAELPRSQFYDGTGVEVYRMTQAWLTNGTRVDVSEARCTVLWKRRGGRAHEAIEVYGLWYPKIASGLLSPATKPVETTNLPSNADTRHLALAVKSNSTDDAYVVGTQSYYAGAAYPNFEHPKYRLEPGIYDVSIEVFAAGGLRGHLGVEIHWGGGGGDIISIL